MTIATKNGSVIIKDGSVAQNCGCCQRCLAWKSEGWAGSVLDFGIPGFNGDGILPVGTVRAPSTIQVGIGVRFTTMLLTVTSDELILTVPVPSSRSLLSSGFIRLRSTNVSGLLSGEEVQVSEVIENTTSQATDVHGRKSVDTVGSFTLRLQQPSGACSCDSCAPNRFNLSLPAVLPSTYSLQFTNTGSAPAGPRTPPEWGPSSTQSLYGGFLPPNSWKTFAQSGEQITYSGCDSYMSRFQSAIVLRQVQGQPYVYLSDPIQIRPCEQARYRLDICGENRNKATLSAASSLLGSNQRTFAGGLIDGLVPPCGWHFLSHSNNPQAFSDFFNNFEFSFGWFATATPGGVYSPEVVVECSRGTALAEGCFGTKCPPGSVFVTISDAEAFPELNGTFELQASELVLCDTSLFQTSGALSNFFAGRRGIYSGGGSFPQANRAWSFRVARQSASALSSIFGIPPVEDLCPCESRPVLFAASYSQIQFFPGSNVMEGFTSTFRTPPGGYACQPLCHDSDVEIHFGNVIIQQNNSFLGSNFPSIGNVMVTLPAAT